ncbi:MAG: fumarylacetoacetate hydrolase family protein [Arenicellales bacterium]|nr:fumarylacetoacetate hydrolase family protein [Gammaproteobacteria bacterium]MDP7063525.1 fumarylacetoacetate hydrolase family protein [Arenicellales bacterium]
MKLVTFTQSGKQSYGFVDNDTITDIGQMLASTHPDLKSLIGDDYAKLISSSADTAPRVALSDVQLLPPITNPDKIICVGLNYESHRKETGRPEVEFPTLFTRFANSQIGDGEAMWRPAESTSFDYEGELAVIIGSGGWKIPEDKALEHVAGYSCYNDGSVRDWQRHTSQFTPGKNFRHTGPFGPWLVTTDEIPDPSTLTLTTRLNGEVMQHATTDLLIFTIPVLINYISRFTRLEPGDVIVSGTPGGVGFKRDPQVFMKPGDVVEVEISKIGILKNPIEAESMD